jgi:putative oxidoreductase
MVAATAPLRASSARLPAKAQRAPAGTGWARDRAVIGYEWTMTVTRLLARPMLASMFVVGGINALKDSEAAAERAKPVTDAALPLAHKVAPNAPIPDDPKTLVRINAGVQIAAGLALATGRMPRLSSLALAATLVPTTAAGHRFWEEKDPARKSEQRIHFFKNVSALGGLMIAAVDTEGRPGLAWRAKRAAADVRKEAKHVRKAAKREAKLARKSV